MWWSVLLTAVSIGVTHCIIASVPITWDVCPGRLHSCTLPMDLTNAIELKDSNTSPEMGSTLEKPLLLSLQPVLFLVSASSMTQAHTGQLSGVLHQKPVEPFRSHFHHLVVIYMIQV